MTVLEQVRNFIKDRSPATYCDDCIAKRRGLSVRQHANHKTRELANEPGFDRRIGVCKIDGRTKKVIKYIDRI